MLDNRCSPPTPTLPRDGPAQLRYIRFDRSQDAVPWYGMRKGKDEVVGFFQAIGGAVDVSEFNPRSFTSNDAEVMVLIDFTMKSKETGREASMQIFHYWHFRDGKVDDYRGTEDTAATLAMLGE